MTWTKVAECSRRSPHVDTSDKLDARVSTGGGNAVTAKIHDNSLDGGFHCEAWGSKCHFEARGSKWLCAVRNTMGRSNLKAILVRFWTQNRTRIEVRIEPKSTENRSLSRARHACPLLDSMLFKTPCSGFMISIQSNTIELAY
jgi:hypothetical protein